MGEKFISVGLLAHVDAGKTTLSEALLYKCGAIRELGRVDNRDAFLDTNTMERERGITIFSKQARFNLGDTVVTLLDTPGHMDFSSEMERTLQVLDYAILVISGADGVQGHTQTLWRLLKRYRIPAFLFINKMDQQGTDKALILQELKKRLDSNCVDFSETDSEEFFESVAMCEEESLNAFLENGTVELHDIRRMIQKCLLFPCFFGSALKLAGIGEFIEGLARFTESPDYPQEFGAKVFKITRDASGSRLTHMKITGGSLKVRTSITEEEKINQIRLYSGEKFEAVNEVKAGEVCAVTGLSTTSPGDGLGIEKVSGAPVLEPVFTCRLILPEGCDAATVLPKLKQLDEEEPGLHIIWDELLQEIQVQIMGEVQTEILKCLILDRFGIEVEIGAGNIVYKETIANTVEGVGHFEPLRHYAEVHLLLEPGKAGSGLQFETDCSEDILDKNWQRLILTHLREKEHKGVLTGAPITDMKITLAAGRAHQKHTEGGDFRQATYRAVRQGLKEAESVLLEPYYEFRMELPENMIGRAMTDIDKMHGKVEVSQSDGELAVLTGIAPVSAMQGYQQEVIGYTKGHGRLFYSVKGYDVCHNAEEVIAAKGYDSERDLRNPTGSVFCAHGAGFPVEWNRVKDYMHVESVLAPRRKKPETEVPVPAAAAEEMWIDHEEIDRILSKTFYANSQGKETSSPYKKRVVVRDAPVRGSGSKKPDTRKEYLLVDGYNIIFAWEELKELAALNIDAARGKLLDVLCNYQGIRKCELIAVFDAYRVKGHQTEVLDYHNIHVVYTKEAETADQYIEKFAHANREIYRVIVATSDGLEQIIVRGQGSELMSARELKERIAEASARSVTAYQEQKPTGKAYLLDNISGDTAEALKNLKE